MHCPRSASHSLPSISPSSPHSISSSFLLTCPTSPPSLTTFACTTGSVASPRRLPVENSRTFLIPTCGHAYSGLEAKSVDFFDEILDGIVHLGEFLVGVFSGGIRSIELWEFLLCFLERGSGGVEEFGFVGDEVEGLGEACVLHLISLKELHLPVYLDLLRII